MDALLAQLKTDAFEERTMAILNVLDAYLNTKIPKDKFVLIKLEDEFVDIMCEVNSEFINDIQQEGNKTVLYLRVLKALCGCAKSALLWYNLYKDNTEKEGFVLNPYGKYTENKMINGKQCTTQWYVDNNKVTHVSGDVITGFIDITKKCFGELVADDR